MRDPDLWAQIETEILTTPEGKPLAEVLASQTSLGRKRSGAAELEYRRWMYLRAIMGEGARPAPAMGIIEGWHCEGMQPRAPGNPWKDAEYPETLAAYAKEFGASPPEKLWPSQKMLHRGQNVTLYFLGGMVGFGVAMFSGLWPLAIVAVLVAAVPAMIYNTRGPWDATLKADPTAQDNALGYEGPERTE